MAFNRLTNVFFRQVSPRHEVQLSQTGGGQGALSERARLVDGNSSQVEEVDVPKLMRKLHRRVLPMCLLILLFANIDRGNLGFVANQMCRDLKLTQTQYGTGASAFFVGFLFSRIPSNVAMRYFGAPLWLMTIMFVWGVTAAGLSFITTVYEFYILRFLMGVAEGGAFPGVWYYLTGFFPDDRLTFPYAITATAAPTATALSGPIAAAFFAMDGTFNVEAWRALLFFEGFVPAVMAPVMFHFIPKNIAKAHFLTGNERVWLENRLKLERPEKEPKFSEELRILFRSVPFWIISIYGIVHLALFAIIMYWTTLMIEQIFTSEENEDNETCASSKSLGVASVVMTAFVFTLSSLSTLSLGILTSKGSNRSAISGWITVLCGVALASWILTDTFAKELGLISLTVAACAMNAPTGLVAGLLVSHFDSHTKSTALSVFATIVTLGALIGPIGIGAIVDHYGNYDVASGVLGGFGVAGGLLLLTVKDPLQQNNNLSGNV